MVRVISMADVAADLPRCDTADGVVYEQPFIPEDPQPPKPKEYRKRKLKMRKRTESKTTPKKVRVGRTV